ncbi:2-oxo-4-hydroxy-4-carboxy-5-ureidoimidazoline decarboxylase-like [Amblyraja radiata]|uniref:2-oxo-4-hydroxy-4-carboxy-5-ureidoimidazoline decarboxylase-like n=1 Tax=Amblyraja radiata TaxID=386614 RepID=UPI001401F474|nr:2-oxo-4-hydroxy-4-carboxy-5-ureidoimidazoline decarboxylase-like [Amblyraja radiata]
MEANVFNSMDYEEFVGKFGNVVERCPMIAAAVWSDRPFSSLEALENTFGDFIDSLPPSGKKGLLRCISDLAGRDMVRGTLSPESQSEQSQGGMTTLTLAQRSQLSELNASYKDRFHFPFVICARMNDTVTIIEQMTIRIHHSLERELETGIGEVKKICRLRLLDIFNQVAPAPSSNTSTGNGSRSGSQSLVFGPHPNRVNIDDFGPPCPC